jgi:uncharacterized protein (DUF983 family)
MTTPGKMLRRGARKRCAVCGGGHLFTGWWRMKPTCPTCGTRFEREPGFFVGAVFVNFALAEVLMFAWLAVVTIVTIPHPPFGWLLGGALAIGVLLPIVLYPISKTLWFAVHVAFRFEDQ